MLIDFFLSVEDHQIAALLRFVVPLLKHLDRCSSDGWNKSTHGELIERGSVAKFYSQIFLWCVCISLVRLMRIIESENVTHNDLWPMKKKRIGSISSSARPWSRRKTIWSFSFTLVVIVNRRVGRWMKIPFRVRKSEPSWFRKSHLLSILFDDWEQVRFRALFRLLGNSSSLPH